MEIVEASRNREQVDVFIQGVLSAYQPLVSDSFTVSERNCIFHPPLILYRHNKNAYIPNGFSFGPWHYRKPFLVAAQDIKYKCLAKFLGTFRSPRERLSALEEEVRNMIPRIRASYAGPIDLEDEELVRIFVLDGTFLIEMFRSNPVVSDAFGSAFYYQFICHDLILLENQIPWFVLEGLFDRFWSIEERSLLSLAINFFKHIFSFDGISINEAFLVNQRVEHILDLLRLCLFISFLRDVKTNSSLLTSFKSLFRRLFEIFFDSLIDSLLAYLKCATTETKQEFETQLPSASRLKEAGVKFKRARSRPMLDIRFHNGVLEVPYLVIHQTTESLFRNLIAFEQCRRSCRPVVTSYAKLMDNLINTVEDLDILCKNGIICNSLNPEDAIQFFNRLYNDTYISRSHYFDVYWEINHYYRRWWPRWRAFYIHNYFTKPWAIVSQIFALFILTLAILQVVLKK